MNSLVQTAWKRFQNAFPVILFFFVLFLIIVEGFGLQYAIVVSVFTTIFQTQHTKSHTLSYYVKLLLNSYILCGLAFLSSLNLPLCILFNFTVPFLLVFLHSSQFNQKGYFSYAMIFVFLELMPPTLSTLPMELAAITVAVFVLGLSLQLYARLFLKTSEPWAEIRLGIGELADLLDLIASGNLSDDTSARLRRLEQDFHRLSYGGHGFFALKTETSRLYDMLAILFQRASYLVTDTSWKNSVDEAHIDALHRLAAYLRTVRDQMSSENNRALISEARAFLNGMNLENGRLRIFFRSFLHMLILILKSETEPEMAAPPWQKLSLDDTIAGLRRRCTLESFEMRFALRLSVVMTVSYTISYMVDITHSYWFPMNAFLLLMPAFEESNYRMKTRPVGTAIGCLFVYLVLPNLHTTAGQFVFALAALSIMYCATPGTWNHPIFSTCYALTLASMSIPQTTAISMRLLCLAAAVVLVYVVNHFVFPTSRDTMFRFNMRTLFRLHNSYWEIIRQTLYGRVDLSSAREILTYFHMIYGEAAAYINSLPDSEGKSAGQKTLIVLWQIFSELEQMEFLIQTGYVDSRAFDSLLDLAAACQKRFIKGNHTPLPELRETSLPAADGEPVSAADLTAGRSPLVIAPSGNLDLDYVIRRYLKNAESVTAAFGTFA